MKYITCTLVILALFGSQDASAIQVKQKFTDDLVKSLAEEMSKEIEKPDTEEKPAEPTKKEEPKKDDKKKEEPKKTEAKKDDKKPAAKKDDKKAAAAPAKPAAKTAKKEEEEIPMDNAAIKAYSSVIADAAEDSEPQNAVVYSQTMPDEEKEEKKHSSTLGLDPMGSMI